MKAVAAFARKNTRRGHGTNIMCTSTWL